MKNKKLILALAVFLVVFAGMIQNIQAIGIAPATQSLIFEPNLEKTYTLKIFNRDAKEMKVLISAEGELKDYAELETNYVYFLEGETEKKVKLQISSATSKISENPSSMVGEICKICNLLKHEKVIAQYYKEYEKGPIPENILCFELP